MIRDLDHPFIKQNKLSKTPHRTNNPTYTTDNGHFVKVFNRHPETDYSLRAMSAIQELAKLYGIKHADKEFHTVDHPLIHSFTVEKLDPEIAEDDLKTRRTRLSKVDRKYAQKLGIFNHLLSINDQHYNNIAIGKDGKPILYDTEYAMNKHDLHKPEEDLIHNTFGEYDMDPSVHEEFSPEKQKQASDIIRRYVPEYWSEFNKRHDKLTKEKPAKLWRLSLNEVPMKIEIGHVKDKWGTIEYKNGQLLLEGNVPVLKQIVTNMLPMFKNKEDFVKNLPHTMKHHYAWARPI